MELESSNTGTFKLNKRQLAVYERYALEIMAIELMKRSWCWNIRNDSCEVGSYLAFKHRLPTPWSKASMRFSRFSPYPVTFRISARACNVADPTVAFQRSEVSSGGWHTNHGKFSSLLY